MSHRVLYLAIDLFSRGGIQRYCRAQVDALRELLGRDATTTFVLHTLSDSGSSFEEPYEVAFTGSGRRFLSRVDFVVHAFLESLKHRPDIIWANHIKLFPLAYIIGLLCGAPTVVGNVYGLEVWSAVSLLEKLTIRRMSYLVSDSHFTANFVQERYQIPDGRITVIWDPVDITKFVPRPVAGTVLQRYHVPYRPEACYVMTLGRVSAVSRHKGYDRMIDVIHEIPRADIVYLIVGDGDDRLRLEDRVASEGLAGRVFLLGGVPESDLVDVYNAADIFALVSDRGPGRGEGVPLAILEAAACGVPVIVGDEDGSQEAVEQGVNGFIVSPRDPGAIREAVIRLAEQPALRRQMGVAARQRVERYFAYPAFREKTGDVLSRLT